MELEEGTYYIKEAVAPTGAMIDNTVYTLTITDTTSIYNLSDVEMKNYLEFNKYESGTSNLIQEEAKFDLYEWNTSANDYLRLGSIYYNGNGKYSLSPLAGEHTYHDKSGNAVKSIATDCLYYTSANEGKFKIVETEAPEGWKKAEDKIFTMNLSQDGYVNSFTTYSTGIVEEPYYCGVNLSKYDIFTVQNLSGAEFMIQEKVGDKWYDIGKLEETIYTPAPGITYSSYRTSKNEAYAFHDYAGVPRQTITDSNYPLHITTYNGGVFRIVETKTSSEFYVGDWSQEFEITVQSDNTFLSFTNYSKTAPKNRGVGNTIITSKYDVVTKESVSSPVPAEITIYEHIASTDKWLSVGTLNYDEETGHYTTEGTTYQPHKADGTLATVSEEIQPGYLYYTSANQGRYKLVETKAPQNYESGTLNLDGTIEIYEKEFYISSEDGEVIDLTGLEDAAKDTGIYANVDLSKLDGITGEKVLTSDAEFTVYEKIEATGEWLAVGTLIYNETTKTYQSKGMNITLHNSRGEVVYDEAAAVGLYYTSANQGQYKILESESPTNYENNLYEKEFNVTNRNEDYMILLNNTDEAAKDLGVSGTVNVAKYDATTKEKVLTNDTEFTVYEKIAATGEWLAVGTLNYDSETGTYGCQNAEFTFHKEDGTIIDSSNITGFEVGKLYYTTANQGKFKVVESNPPTNYTNGSFSQTFTVNEDNRKYDFTSYEKGAKNTGVQAGVQLQKYDILTNQKVTTHDAKFMLQEWNAASNKWLSVGTLRYDEEKGLYTTDGITITLHDGSQNVIHTNENGILYYTTQNLGKYRILESTAPEFYIIGSPAYEKEFDITKDAASGIVDLTNLENAAKNLGISATVNVAKYDATTKEKVKTYDTEFTVYEKIEATGEWLSVGTLNYDSETGAYGCQNAEFTFHQEDGTVIDSSNITGFEVGKLYYTTANQGKFKVVESNPPTNYTNGSFSQTFTVNEDNRKYDFTSYEKGAKNTGVQAGVQLQKYDILTNQKVTTHDAKFMLQEWNAASNKWLSVGTLRYDEEKGLYTTDGITITLHDGSQNVIHTNENGILYYTTQNLGKYRILESTAPEFYIIGSPAYEKEFDITKDAASGIVDLTNLENAAKNLGISATVKVAKYDRLTKEKVLTGDAEFTIYEHIAATGEWLSVGTLVYNEAAQEYICDSQKFIFHDETGKELTGEAIADFEAGKLYYTSANQGLYKIQETKAPSMYENDGFSQEFNVTTENVTFEYNTVDTGANDTGISGNVELEKTDSLTGEHLSGAEFMVQEWSEKYQTWLSVGTLDYIEEKGLYSSLNATYALHTGNEEDDTVLVNSLFYTTQNLGRYRVVETKSPAGYKNDMYISPELSLTEGLTTFALTDDQQVTNTPIRVSISKKSVTTGKDIIGAKLTVKDLEGNVIDTWITDGDEHIIAAIPVGRYVLIEERASEGYIVASNIEFEVTETAEIQKVEMFDEEVKGKLVIRKTDSESGDFLAGAKFELRDADGTLIQTLVTDENGYAESDLLNFGIYDTNGKYLGSKEYTLTEVMSPNGYMLDSKSQKIKFEYKDDQTGIVEKSMTITNEKEPEVPTGDTNDTTVLLILLLGAALTIGTSIYCKKKEQN